MMPSQCKLKSASSVKLRRRNSTLLLVRVLNNLHTHMIDAEMVRQAKIMELLYLRQEQDRRAIEKVGKTKM